MIYHACVNLKLGYMSALSSKLTGIKPKIVMNEILKICQKTDLLQLIKVKSVSCFL